jgi:transcriptional regulator with XRE-family HTH domain
MNPGSIIRLLRTVEEVSQKELAERLGVSRTYLSQIEGNRRQPSLRLLKEMAKELEVPLPLLIPEEGGADPEIFSELRRILSALLSARIATKKTGAPREKPRK